MTWLGICMGAESRRERTEESEAWRAAYLGVQRSGHGCNGVEEQIWRIQADTAAPGAESSLYQCSWVQRSECEELKRKKLGKRRLYLLRRKEENWGLANNAADG